MLLTSGDLGLEPFLEKGPSRCSPMRLPEGLALPQAPGSLVPHLLPHVSLLTRLRSQHVAPQK